MGMSSDAAWCRSWREGKSRHLELKNAHDEIVRHVIARLVRDDHDAGIRISRPKCQPITSSTGAGVRLRRGLASAIINISASPKRNAASHDAVIEASKPIMLANLAGLPTPRRRHGLDKNSVVGTAAAPNAAMLLDAA